MAKPLSRWMTSLIAIPAFAMGVDGQSQTQAPPPGQVEPQIEKCLHASDESAAEKARREDARAAMRMIDFARLNAIRLYQGDFGWEKLGWSGPVRELMTREGPVGDLARRIKWGAAEPLPGWTISWFKGAVTLPTPSNPSFEDWFVMLDNRDPCRFSYRSTDPAIANAGKGVHVRPLDPK